MNQLDVKRFGFATGATMAALYLGCMFVMATIGTQGSIVFFNSLLHGIDVTTILRSNMPLPEALMGLVETFVLAWLTGATMAAIYNATLNKEVPATGLNKDK